MLHRFGLGAGERKTASSKNKNGSGGDAPCDVTLVPR